MGVNTDPTAAFETAEGLRLWGGCNTLRPEEPTEGVSDSQGRPSHTQDQGQRGCQPGTKRTSEKQRENSCYNLWLEKALPCFP